MFNLLAFEPGKKGEYLKYGAAFAERIGKRHGGNAKIVGNVVDPSATGAPSSHPQAQKQGDEKVKEGQELEAEKKWDEIALAHYPSIQHFRAMLQSEDYQEVNHKHRVGSLFDTAILMTSEIGIAEMMEGKGGSEGRARL